MFNLKGRVAVVTGASSGLGKQISMALAKQGADLVILARRIERLEEFKIGLEKEGVKVLPVKCDVTSTEEVLGKPVHSDEKNEKTTYVTLFGVEGAGKIVEEKSNDAINLLHSLSGKNDYLEELLVQLIHRDR